MNPVNGCQVAVYLAQFASSKRRMTVVTAVVQKYEINDFTFSLNIFHVAVMHRIALIASTSIQARLIE